MGGFFHDVSNGLLKEVNQHCFHPLYLHYHNRFTHTTLRPRKAHSKCAAKNTLGYWKSACSTKRVGLQVEGWLDNGQDVDKADSYGNTGLLLAAEKGLVEVCFKASDL